MLAGGISGLFRPVPLLAGTLALLGMTGVVVKGLSWTEEPSSPETQDPIWWPVAVALLAATTFTMTAKVFTSGTTYFSDDFGYHALAAINWMRAQGFTEMPPSYVAYYPFGSELFPLWFMLPFGHDGWAGLAGAFWGGTASLAVWTAARALNASSTAAAMVAAGALASPQIVGFLVRTFAATDLACGVCLLAATVFAGYAAVENRSATWLAGAAAGMALGSKVSCAPAVAFLGLSLLTRRDLWPRRLGTLAIYFTSAFAACGWWYARNLMLTGNPVFPAQLGPFAGPMTAAIQRSTELLPGLLMEPHPMRFWLGFAGKLLDWPFGLGLVSLAGYGHGLASEWRPKSGELALLRAVRRRLLLVGGVLALLFPITPFSIGSGVVDGQLSLYLRYLTPSFLIGFGLLAPALDGTQAGFWRAVVVLAWGTAWPGPGNSVMVASIAGAAAAWVASAPPRHWRTWAAAGGALLFFGIPALAPRQKMVTDHTLAGTGSTEARPVGAAWAALDHLPKGARVAAITNIPYHRSPLYGSHWQLNPVFLDKNGFVLRPTHQQFAQDHLPGLGFEPFERLDGPTWLERLRKAHVEYVLVSRWNGTEWPPPYEPIRATCANIPIFQDGYSVIWKLQP